MYTPFSYVRKIIFTLGLGLAPKEPISTITLLLVFTFLIMVCIYFFKPFDNPYTDYVTIFMESALTIYVLLLIILALDVLSAENSNRIGMFIVFLLCLTLAICLGWLIYLTYDDIRLKGWCPKAVEEDANVKDTKDDYAQKKY